MGVGRNLTAQNAGWSFGGNVPETFVDHIKQSVPLYELGHELICQISDYFIQGDSRVYEIGTSTGELLRKLAQHVMIDPALLRAPNRASASASKMPKPFLQPDVCTTFIS